MKITFVLPALIKIPCGGAKIISRYAEELSSLGHSVTIIYPIREGNFINHYMKGIAVKIYDILHSVEPLAYYRPNSKVKAIIINSPNYQNFPNSDVIIATGWKTAEWINGLPKSKGKKYYFIQGKEDWLANSNRVMNTWKLAMEKIVVSNWLKTEVEDFTKESVKMIPNAIDFKEFNIINPIEERINHISMMYHRHPVKGSKNGLNVLYKLKNLYPDLQVSIFTARKPLRIFPTWIKLFVRPNPIQLLNIYNSSSIFLHPSLSEGWPLPPAEAMACGCAVVASSNNGVKEYITHQETGMLSPIGDNIKMINNVQSLFDNDWTLKQIANSGHEKISEFNWELNTKLFESILTN